MSQKSPRIAVIGLGPMGAALAKAIAKAGYELRVWNRTFSKASALACHGAIACAAPDEAISESDIVVVCLADYSTWHSITASNKLGPLLENRTVIQLTTGTIEQVRDHARWLEENKASLIDGSIICFPSQIGTDDASLVVAGSEATFNDCGSVLTSLSPQTTYLGDDLATPVVLSRALICGALGAIFGTINGAALCRAGGVPIAHFSEQTRRANSVVSNELVRICESINSDDTVTTEAALKTWATGQAAIRDVATTLGTNTELQDALQSLFRRAIDSGVGDHDISALVSTFGKN